jgi:tagatose 6-phosphate kinase
MITTVTLNAAIDKTYFMKRVEMGKVLRVPSVIADAGGKGINAARVLKLLGCDVTATGFLGGHNGRFIAAELDKHSIKNDFVQVEEESRLALTIIDESTGRSTELIEPGPRIMEEQIDAMKCKIAELAARSRIVTFNGSLPSGVPADLYADLIGIAKNEGAIVFLDASGEALKLAVHAQPDLIKPNEDEAAGLFGERVGADEEVNWTAKLAAVSRLGIGCVIVSLGAKGAAVLWDGAAYRVHVPVIKAVNPVGSGDSFVAGLAAGIADGRSPEECLKLAAAAGSANALNERAGYVRLDEVANLKQQVRIERV